VQLENLPKKIDQGVYAIEDDVPNDASPYLMIVVNDDVHYTQRSTKEKTFARFELTL
jgi:hypothetical protein